jgi:DNA mismatch endonuclease (patch repair protein)
MDRISKARRSANMAAIRSANTQPEITVRRALFAAGLRFRLHRRDLPGRPDIVFPARKIVVFVHGCFWHGCPKCIDGKRAVKSNKSYWTAKVSGNKKRDKRNRRSLIRAGWRVEEIWQCETEDQSTLTRLVARIQRYC